MLSSSGLASLVALIALIVFGVWTLFHDRRGVRLRLRDRRTVWKDFEFFMQDRDHAIAAMTMHMLIHDHWHPEGFDEHPHPFLVMLEQAIEETAGWGPAGAHLYNVAVDADGLEDKEGMLRGGL